MLVIEYHIDIFMLREFVLCHEECYSMYITGWHEMIKLCYEINEGIICIIETFHNLKLWRPHASCMFTCIEIFKDMGDMTSCQLLPTQ